MTTETWQHGFVHTNGIRLHYVEQGEGPLVLLLHGFPEFWYSWRYQIPVLARHSHVVALDLRGFNDSDKPVGVEHYHLSSLVDDVTGVLRFFGQEQAILIGHDWGAAVAWMCAATQPHAISGLVACSLPHLGVFHKMASLSFADHYAALQRLFYILFFRLPEAPERFLGKGEYAFFDAYGLRCPSCFTPEVIAAYKHAIGKPGALTAGLNYYRANLPVEVILGEVPLLDKQVMCPALFLYGDQDQLVGKLAAEWTREFVAAPFTAYAIPACGHCVQQEGPDLVNQYILEFLATGR